MFLARVCVFVCVCVFFFFFGGGGVGRGLYFEILRSKSIFRYIYIYSCKNSRLRTRKKSRAPHFEALSSKGCSSLRRAVLRRIESSVGMIIRGYYHPY